MSLIIAGCDLILLEADDLEIEDTSHMGRRCTGNRRVETNRTRYQSGSKQIQR